MKSDEEHCPIAMGAEAVGDRWTSLVLRELICGSERFSDIRRGVPRRGGAQGKDSQSRGARAS